MVSFAHHSIYTSRWPYKPKHYPRYYQLKIVLLLASQVTCQLTHWTPAQHSGVELAGHVPRSVFRLYRLSVHLLEHSVDSKDALSTTKCHNSHTIRTPNFFPGLNDFLYLLGSILLHLPIYISSICISSSNSNLHSVRATFSGCHTVVSFLSIWYLS